MKRSFRRPLRLARPKAARLTNARHGEHRRLFFESLEDRRLLTTRWVDNTPGMAGTEFTSIGGTQPVSMPGLTPGVTIFTTIGAAVAAAVPGDTINVSDGTYSELVNANKSLLIQGNQFGVDARTRLAAVETVVNGNAGTTSFQVTASDVTIDGFQLEGQTSAVQFGAGVVLGAGTSGSEVRNNIIQNNMVGLYLANNSALNQTVIEKNVIRNNNNPGPASGGGIYTDQFVAGGPLQNVLIDSNQFSGNSGDAGIDFSSTSPGSQSNITISNNEFTANARALIAFNLTNSSFTDNTVTGSTGAATADIRLFEGNSNLTIERNVLQGGAGRGLRVSNLGTGAPDATGVSFNFNSLSGYAGNGIELDAGAYTGPFDATCNWWGDITGPTTGTNPGGIGEEVVDPDGLVDFQPWLVYAPDGDPVAPGVQLVTNFAVPAQVAGFTATNNNYRRLVNVLDCLQPGQTATLSGVFDWTEANALAAWALGNDGVAATLDDYSLLVRPDLNNVTITAAALGSATIQGPGDLPGVNLEGVFTFNDGDNQNWTFSNLEIFDFDLSIAMFNGAGGSDAYNGTHILGNHIRIPTDLNATVAPADVNQNIGIHYSFGVNQLIQNNVIDIEGDGLSDSGANNFAASVGMQSNTSGGAVYEGLLIDNNTINVLNAQAADPERVLGIWENGHAHSSNITVSNNDFVNLAGGNNPALNLQRAFRVTSHSSALTTVTYTGNDVTGANIGFEWLSASAFAGNQAVRLWQNTLTNNNTGVLVQSGGIANLYQNTITGSGLGGGVHVITGSLTASGAVTNAVQENFLSGGTGDGIRLDATAGAIAPIFNNDLGGNAGLGVNNLSAALVNASGNWWGGATPAAVSAEVSANVDYTPWLDVGTDTSATTGFQGDFSTLHVDDNSPQSGAGGRVQEGIDLTTVGGTVIVEAGVYNELANANKTVTLLGAQANVDPRAFPAGRPGGESIIDGFNQGGAIQITADNVEVNGFTIRNVNDIGGLGLNAGIWTNPAFSGTDGGHEIRYNIIENNVQGIFLNNTGVLPTTVELNLIQNNNSPGPASGEGIYSVLGLDNATIQDNKITGHNDRSILLFPVSNTTIDDNELIDRGIGLSPTNVSVTDNIVTVTAGAVNAINLTPVSGTIDVSGNTVSGPFSNVGIRIASGAAVTPTVANNNVTGGNIAYQFSGLAGLDFTNNSSSGNTAGGSIGTTPLVNVDTNNSANTVRVNVTPGDTIATSPGEFSVDGQLQPITYTGVTTLDVDTLDGDDVVKVAAHPTTIIDLDGGNPAVPVGDTLTYYISAAPFTFGPAVITTTGSANINHVNFETFDTFGGAPVINGTGDDDELIINATGPDSGSYQLIQDYSGENGGPFAGPVVAFSGISSLTFNGLAGDDKLTINNPGGDVFAPSPGGVVYDGGSGSEDDGGDELSILGGAAASVEHVLASDSSGSVRYNGSATDNIAYSNLEPVTDTIVAGTRTFTFLGAAETITLTDAAGAMNTIDSTLGESITFSNPTAALVIDTTATAGADTVNLSSIDADGPFDADFTVTAKTTDSVDFNGATLNIGSGDASITAGAISFSAGSLSTTGDADLTATSTTISNGTAGVDVTAVSLTASAVTGIDLDTTVTNITASTSGAGNIDIDESDGANVLNVSAANGDADVSTATGDLNVTTASASGTVFLTATAGAINDANGAANNITAASLVASTSTGIDLDTDVTNLTATASGLGSINIDEANGANVLNVAASTGNADVSTATGNLNVTTVSASGTVLLSAVAGAITDANGGATNVTATFFNASSATGIDLDTAVTSITASTTGVGNIDIDESDAVALINVATNDGDIFVDAGGALLALLVDANGAGRDAKLTTTAGNIDVGSVQATDFVRLDAAAAITDFDLANPDIAGTNLILTSASGVATSGDPLETAVSNLAAVGGTGGVFIANTGGLTIAALNYMGLVTGVTGAGAAEISAASPLTVAANVIMGGNVLLTAADTIGGGNHLVVNSGVTVQSTGGDVTLRAGDDLTIQSGAIVNAAGKVTLLGDFGNADAAGSTISILGQVISSGSQAMAMGESNSDSIILNPSALSSSILLDGQGSNDSYFVQNGNLTSPVNISDSGGGSDTATVNGLAGAETYVLANNVPNAMPQTGGTVVNTTEGETVAYTTTLEFLTVHGQGGNDVFDVQPSQTATITINGGSPSFGDPGVPPGDTLDFDPLNNTFTIVGKTIVTDGGNPAAFKGVNFIDIENLPLDPLGTATWRFDFNSLTAATQAGYTPVAHLRKYGLGTLGSDYGWVTTAPGSVDRGNFGGTTFEDLLQDGHLDTVARTFRADVTNGWYLVSVKTGDAAASRDQLVVRNGDMLSQVLVSGVSTALGQFEQRTFVVQVTDGTLDLQFSDTGNGPGVTPGWMVNGLEIRPGQILTMGSPTPATKTADGVTIDTYQGFNAPANTLITVMATLDSNGDNVPDQNLVVTSTDLDAKIVGVQVMSNAMGQFTYHIRRPSASGVGLVKLEAFTGEETGCVAIMYAAPMTRRFDFNAPGSPTQAPVAASPPGDPTGYLGVLPTDLFATGVGYGWLTGPSSADRGASVTGPQAELRRDLHYQTAGRTFRMELAPNTNYTVNVTTGDAMLAHDNLRVRANGVTVLPDVDTGANRWTHRSFSIFVGGSGILDLEFSDQGGADATWVVNGLEVYSVVGTHTLMGAPSGMVTGTGATANSLVTVTSTLGVINPAQDVSPVYEGVQVQADPMGGFSFTITPPPGGGTATVTSEEITGARRGSTMITFPAPLGVKFDFNALPTSPTQTGYTSVLPSNLYSFGSGFGWVTTGPSSVDRGAGVTGPQAELRRDLQYQTAPRTFRMDVAPGTYTVNVTMGDATYARDNMQVSANGGGGPVIVLPDVDVAANRWTHRSFMVTVGMGGQLDLTFADLGGADATWVINGIELYAMVGTHTLMGTANGVVTGTGATPNSFVTVTSSMGTISSAQDQSVAYEGIQRQADAMGNFSFTITAPSGVGAVMTTVTSEEITGARRGGPIMFSLNPPPVAIIDDGDAGFAVTGSWLSAAGQGFQNDVRYSAAGTGLDVATWTFTGLIPGSYRVSATWSIHANRATNAPFTVINGPIMGGTPFGTVLINQELAPNDFMDSGASWEDLGGPYMLTGSTLSVRLTDLANEYVIADAIRIERLSPLHVEAPAAPLGINLQPLTSSQAQPLVQQAIAAWSGSNPQAAQLLAGTEVLVTNLPSGVAGLASAQTRTIWLDDNGDGWGWSGAGGGRLDLASVIAHELGHILGMDDITSLDHAEDVMSAILPAGFQRLPELGLAPLPAATAARSADALFSAFDPGASLGAVSLGAGLGAVGNRNLTARPLSNFEGSVLRAGMPISAASSPLAANLRRSVQRDLETWLLDDVAGEESEKTDSKEPNREESAPGTPKRAASRRAPKSAQELDELFALWQAAEAKQPNAAAEDQDEQAN